MSSQSNIQPPTAIQIGSNGVYFIGIGGIGMSALARYFNALKIPVSGYDRTATVLTQQLESEGIAIHYEENISLIPKNIDVVVYTPAIPKDHAELVYYQQNGYTVVKRSDVLQWISANSFNICIAGTHGKTTTTSMTAHILRHSGYGCNAFLGGIAANYNTNFWSSSNNVVVVEADEYDRSFLKLTPDVAIITAMDADHLDIYGTAEAVETAFLQFSDKIKKGGCLIAKHGMARQSEFTTDTVTTYSLSNTDAHVHATNIVVENGSYRFNVVGRGWTIDNVMLHMGGLHNIENAVAAIAVAKFLNIEEDKIVAALDAFKGVKRRFEYHLKTDTHVLIDDYAHHPEELRALITGVRSIFPHKKLTLLFQPHLYSRTNDLANDFATSLDLADEVVLLPIYPARELPIEGVDSEMLLRKMKLTNKQVLSKQATLAWVATQKPELVVMAGAGDIDGLIEECKNNLLHNHL
jgi:UDP-N-acetylmuramate--alanine ligase